MEVTYEYLKNSLNPRIKDLQSRDEAYQELLTIEREELPAKSHVYWLYLAGKYHKLAYQDSKQIESAERANDWYDDMARISYELNFLPDYEQLQKYRYARAYAKYLLGKFSKSESTRIHFRSKARHLAQLGVRHFPHNSSFNWLIQQF